MRYHLVLKRFDFDIETLKKKLVGLGYIVLRDVVSGGLIAEGKGDGSELLQLSEIDNVLREEKSGLFQQERLRQDVVALGKRLGSISLRIKMAHGVKIPASILKKKLLKPLHYAGVKVEDAGVPLLIELYLNKGIYYRILEPLQEKRVEDKSRYRNLAVLLEHPRLVEEVADVLRICLIFGLKLYVIHNNAKDFERLLNAAKKITKGKLSDFPVEIVKNAHEAGDYGRIGFSKHALRDEKNLKEFFKNAAERKILLVLGNDTYGLSQKSRDELHTLFHLTPDYQKPLKANQALAYVLGLYAATRND